MLARGANQASRLFQVVAPERIGDDLDGAQPELDATVDVAPHIVGRLAQGIDRAIGQDTRSLAAAEKFGQRLAANLAADVPEGDVDGADRMDDHAASAIIASAVIHPLPARL